MTDEEFGRAWAKQQRVEPSRFQEFWYWQMSYTCDDSPPGLPVALFRLVQDGVRFRREKSEAYADLGRAVRAIHAAVPPLRGGE